MAQHKVVFLDIDGVLNSRQWIRRMPKRGSVPMDHGWFDPDTIALLNRLTEATGAVIVISSAWRQYGEKYMRELLAAVGVTAEVIGVTPILYEDGEILTPVCRGEEIQAWLDEHADEVASFVILDDIDEMQCMRPNCLVQTNREVGLTEKNVESAMAWLDRRMQVVYG